MAAFSGHGFSNLMNADSTIIRFAWFFIISAAFTGALSLIISSVINFKNYDVVTNIRIVHESEMSFPAVTFCPVKYSSFDKVLILRVQFDSKEMPVESLKIINIFDRDEKTDKKCLQFNAKNIFSADEILKSSKQGYIGGLRLFYYSQIPIDLAVFIHENTELPIYYESLLIAKFNRETPITIEKTAQISLGSPYNDCIEKEKIDSLESRLLRETVNLGYSYKRSNCYELCFNKYCPGCDLSVSFDYKSKCSDDCPLECELAIYSASFSSEKQDLFWLTNTDKNSFKESIYQEFDSYNLTDTELFGGNFQYISIFPGA